jgi:glycosyltransferase involved in cell wall biosynthesis
MQKVLILTYYWPPSGGAGVQRWLKFVKYMREFGWEPVVYTVKNGEIPVVDESLLREIPENIEVIKTDIWEPYLIYKRFIGRKKNDKINASFLSENKKTGLAEKISVWIRGNFFIPDARKFWIQPSIQHLLPLIEKDHIKYVISSGPPHSMHIITMGLKQKFPQLKWVADFRDPWTNIDFYEKLMLTKWADKKHHQMEREVLKNADCILSIGQHMQAEFENIYKLSNGQNLNKFKTITNGYDETDLVKSKVEKDNKFSIAHIGTLVKDRDPLVLWKVLNKLINTNSLFEQQLEIKLIGKVDIAVMESIEKMGLRSYINKIDYLPHDKVIEEQQRARLLLLLVNNTKNANGILTGKFFEYMASGSSILAIGPVEGELASIMAETGTGLITDFEDELNLEKNILSFFDGKTTVRREEKIEKYSRRNLTKQLCALLDELGSEQT